MQVIDADDFTQYIIEPTLRHLGDNYNQKMASKSASALLLGIAAAESNLGYKLHQVGGPALGVFQMEPATHNSLWDNFIVYRSDLTEALLELVSYGYTKRPDMAQDMIGNMKYACAMARLKIWTAPEPLPAHNDLEALGRYWKNHYNTASGKGTVEHFLDSYPL